MAAWNGFPQELLKAAHLGTATYQVQFMFDWNTAAASNCTNNPVDISHQTSTSGNCTKLTQTRTAQNYSTHGAAAAAFSSELHSGDFPHLLSALGSSDPYAYSDPASVEADLVKWGSAAMAAYYTKNATGGSSGGGGSGAGGRAPRAHQGWAALQHSLNDNWKPALNASERNIHAALRSLGRGRKVKL